LYQQDCADLMSYAPGTVQRFRYDKQWVSVDDDSSDGDKLEWEGLKDTAVVCYFVASKDPRDGETVFIPMRTGVVIDTFAEGDFLFVDFRVGGYVDQSRFRPAIDDGTPERTESAALAAAVQTSRSLERLLNNRFPAGVYPAGVAPLSGGSSAVLGASPALLGEAESAQASAAFAETVKLLSYYRLGVEAEQGNVTFVRLTGLRKLHSSTGTAGEWLSITSGAFKLRSGARYSMEVLTLNESSADGVRVVAELPEYLRPSTLTEVSLGSKYDSNHFEFTVKPCESPLRGQIVVTAGSTDAGIILPRLVIPVRVIPSRWSVGIAIATATASGLTAGLVVYATLVSASGNGPATAFGWLAGASAAVTVFGAMVRRRLGLSSD
jgi:hypothetical protein